MIQLHLPTNLRWGIPAGAHTAPCLSEVGAGLEKPSHKTPTIFARPTQRFWTSCLSPVLLARCLLLQSCLFVPTRLLFPTEYFAFASTVSCSSSCG